MDAWLRILFDTHLDHVRYANTHAVHVAEENVLVLCSYAPGEAEQTISFARQHRNAIPLDHPPQGLRQDLRGRLGGQLL